MTYPAVRLAALAWAVVLAFGCAACSPPGTGTCTAGLFDALIVRGAPSPTVALQRFLHDSLEAQGMPPLATWRLSAIASNSFATFRSGGAQVVVALRPDGWEVTNYRTC